MRAERHGDRHLSPPQKKNSGCSAVGRAPALVTVNQSLRNWCTDMIPEDLMSSNLIYPSSRRAWVQIPLPRQKNLVRFDIFRIIVIYNGKLLKHGPTKAPGIVILHTINVAA